uniref:Uncharacterized protein n=1 Tax=Oryza glumipatula TaxID=40148 RepID=A0A0D9ZIM2_9ORYZ
MAALRSAAWWGSDGDGGAASATRWGRTGMGDGGGCDGCERYPPMREDEPRSWGWGSLRRWI